jgi:hypothetical protein
VVLVSRVFIILVSLCFYRCFVDDSFRIPAVSFRALASLPLLLTICSYLSLVRLRALVLPLYINHIFLHFCNVVRSFSLSFSA